MAETCAIPRGPLWKAPVVHVVTRENLIRDGTLVDLMQPGLAQEVQKAGFTLPVGETGGAA